MCAFVKTPEEIVASLRPKGPLEVWRENNPFTNDDARQRTLVALDVGTMLLPVAGTVNLASKAVRGAAKTASIYKGTRAVKNAKAARAAAAKAQKVAAKGGSIRREERYGNQALARGYKARDQFQDMETYARLAQQADSLAKAIERLPGMRKEYTRLRAAYNAGTLASRGAGAAVTRKKKK